MEKGAKKAKANHMAFTRAPAHTIRRAPQKKAKECSFCKEVGHCISCCPRMELLGEQTECDKLIHQMMDVVPFCIVNEKDKIMANAQWNRVYHIQIHYLKSKVQPTLDRPKPFKFLCCISCQFSVIMAGFDNILVPLEDVIKHLQVVQHSNTKRVFSCLNKAYGSELHDLERQLPLELYTLTASQPIKEISIGHSQMVLKTPSYKASHPTNSWEKNQQPKSCENDERC